MKIAPDLVWLVDEEVRACIDVKYKVEKHGQYPNADLYQMAAYCRRFGLEEGWLLYAAGQVGSERLNVIDGPNIGRVAIAMEAPLSQVWSSTTQAARSATAETMATACGRQGGKCLWHVGRSTQKLVPTEGIVVGRVWSLPKESGSSSALCPRCRRQSGKPELDATRTA